tara:strand:- start:116 stop:628 length:513 start_codon:yes stop_codon:yes gene_type:complete
LPRKRTKEEALERLVEASQLTPKGLKGKPKLVRDAAFLGAAGLIMLDPLNRLADDVITVPLDMICIPAYQAYMIDGQPALTIYIRAGETIMPTGGNVDDVEQGMAEAASLDSIPGRVPDSRKRKVTAYQKKYKAAFKSVAPKYKLKNGKWKKGGFKAAVRAAHKKAGGKK